jgi:hypothetical protein
MTKSSVMGLADWGARRTGALKGVTTGPWYRGYCGRFNVRRRASAVITEIAMM